MDDSLGNMLRGRRKELHLTQADLANRLNVGQQAVARWEKGKSRPSRVTVIRLAQVLGEPALEWLKLAGHQTGRGEPSLDLPVRPLLGRLPLDQLTDDDFERFTHMLVKALYPEGNVHRAGGRGHAQHGIDVVADNTRDGRLIFQSKREQQFGPAKVKSAVEVAGSQEADKRVLTLSRIASPAARKMAGEYSWEIWDHDDIVRIVQQELSRDDAQRIIDNFFPGHREHFLGLREKGPWANVDEYFSGRLEKDSAFSHVWGLVGRDSELQALLDWFTGGEAFGFLTGAAGVGKTRLLLELARRLEQQEGGLVIRFVETAAQVQLEDLERLGSGPSVVLIVDDAHDRDDIETIVHGALARGIRVLLATRPYGRALLLQDIARAGGHDADSLVDLKPLASADSRQLASEILGAREDSAVVQRLVSATGDCTLFTVAASVLLKAKSIDPALLSNTVDFRETILSRMYEDYAKGVGVLPYGLDPHEVLQFLAAAQPFDLNDSTMLDTAANIFGRAPRDAVVRALGLIEHTGIAIRRGSRLRVQPDLLADHILSQACYDFSIKVPTGYAERVWKHASGSVRRNLLVNLGRIDWRLSTTEDMRQSLLDMAWRALEDDFKKSGIAERVSLMQLVENVAYFQPRRALDLVRWALANEIDGEETGIFGRSATYNDVRNAAASVLRSVAHHLELLEEACDILWQLAQSDKRPTNQFPDHPLRILQGLVSYSRLKSLVWTERLVDRALGWINDKLPASLSPFDVLDTALAAEAEDNWAEGYKIVYTSFSPLILGADRLREIRCRIVGAALEQLGSSDIFRATRAVRTLGAALSYPAGMFGRKTSDEETAWWDGEVGEILKQLSEQIDLSHLDATVAVELREQIEWHADSSVSTIKQRAVEVLERLSQGLEFEVAEALMFGPWRRHLHRKGKEWSDEEEQKWLVAIAKKLIDSSRTEGETAEYLENRLTAIASALGNVSGTPGPFVAAIVRQNPDVSTAIIERVLVEHNSVLMFVSSTALSELRKIDPTKALSLARSLFESGHRDAKLQAAASYGWGSSTSPVLSLDEIALIRELAEDDDIWVAQNLVGGIHSIAEDNPAVAIEILTSMRIGRSPDLADRALMLFAKDDHLKIEMLNNEARRTILIQLEGCSSLDGHWVGEFLGALCKIHLDDVARLLMKRVELAETDEASKDFHTIPFGWDERSPIKTTGLSDRKRVLKEICNWAIEEVKGWRRRYDSPRLFAVIADSYDEEVLDVIQEGLAEDISVAKRVAHLLTEASKDLVWSKTQWTVNALDAASRRDIGLYKAIGSALHSAVESGIRSGTPGEPFPADLEQRDKAREIADSLPLGSAGERFYRSLQRSAEKSIRRERDDDWQ